jgi:mannose/cellobiose epimerase-like protein (N-acyl-D-glucosamine 2-epimerase family)
MDRVKGGFHEQIEMDRTPSSSPRRARVQGRQSFVFAFAGKLGWDGAWYDAAQHGLAYLDQHFRGYDGLYRTKVMPDGRLCDGAVKTYDQSFVLLAAAQLYGVRPER